jgi:hypothetical protein
MSLQRNASAEENSPRGDSLKDNNIRGTNSSDLPLTCPSPARHTTLYSTILSSEWSFHPFTPDTPFPPSFLHLLPPNGTCSPRPLSQVLFPPAIVSHLFPLQDLDISFAHQHNPLLMSPENQLPVLPVIRITPGQLEIADLRGHRLRFTKRADEPPLLTMGIPSIST